MGRFIGAAALPNVNWITSQLNLTMSAGLLLMLLGIGMIDFGLRGPEE